MLPLTALIVSTTWRDDTSISARRASMMRGRRRVARGSTQPRVWSGSRA
jgi:hypothetical protein